MGGDRTRRLAAVVMYPTTVPVGVTGVSVAFIVFTDTVDG